jgi:hypothetical protein
MRFHFLAEATHLHATAGSSARADVFSDAERFCRQRFCGTTSGAAETFGTSSAASGDAATFDSSCQRNCLFAATQRRRTTCTFKTEAGGADSNNVRSDATHDDCTVQE